MWGYIYVPNNALGEAAEKAVKYVFPAAYIETQISNDSISIEVSDDEDVLDSIIRFLSLIFKIEAESEFP